MVNIRHPNHSLNGRFTACDLEGVRKFWAGLPYTAFEFRDQRALIGSAMVHHHTEHLSTLLPYVSFYDKSPFQAWVLRLNHSID